MSTPVISPVEEQIDQKAYIKARNEGLPKPVGHIQPPIEEKPVEKKVEEQPSIKVPRHIRRENNRLREEAAELRGRLAAYETLGVKPNGEPAKPTSDVDPEPKLADFTSEGEFLRALGRWEGRQGAKEAIGKRDEQTKEERETAELQAHAREMDTKFNQDKESIADWEDVRKAALEDDDAPKIDSEKDRLLLALILHSDVRAFMLHHLAKDPEELQRLLDMREDPNGLIGRFKRLEGGVEWVYSKKEPKKEAAEASDKTEVEAKDRKGPENTEQARAKPKPSTEVAARGGTAPPSEPIPGSKAWIAKRNAERGGR